MAKTTKKRDFATEKIRRKDEKLLAIYCPVLYNGMEVVRSGGKCPIFHQKESVVRNGEGRIQTFNRCKGAAGYAGKAS